MAPCIVSSPDLFIVIGLAAALPLSFMTINTPELRLEMNEGEPHQLVLEFAESADFPGGKITDIDGVRVDFEDGFGLARASNTTPALILRFEADDEAALNRIQEQFRTRLQALRNDLILPF